jgi:hypothetical protein
MADRAVYTREAARAGIDAIVASIADSGAVPALVGKLRLFDETVNLDEDTTRAALILGETTLTGYPAGGFSILDFGAPLDQPLGGAVATSTLITVAYASGPAVLIAGYWLEDAATPTPQVRYAFKYDPPRPLALIGQGWPLVVQMGYGANVVVSG